MNEILILMATYNGERYVEEQLDSIINQSCQSWDMIISDDNSTDGTCELINKKIENLTHKISLVMNKGTHGAKGNFAYLMKLAGDYDYIMFSDQDDVWDKDKIRYSLKKMREIEYEKGKDSPVLVYVDKEDVDAKLAPLTKREITYKNDFLSILAQDPVYGCTMMINKALFSRVRDVPPYAQMHDYYIALVASICRGIHRVPLKLIKYRHHSSNVTGGINNYSLIGKFLTWRRMNDGIELSLLQNYHFCKENFEIQAAKEFVDMIDSRPLARILKAIKLRYRRATICQTFRLYFVLFSMPYPLADRFKI